MSFSHEPWAQRNLDNWLEKYDAAHEDEHGRLEHEVPVPVDIVRMRRAHDRLLGFTHAQAVERHPMREHPEREAA